MSDKVSLSEYASKNKGRPRKCATCNLEPDVLKEVNQGLRDGIGHRAIGEWLNSVKNIYTNPTNYHFSAGHHTEDA